MSMAVWWWLIASMGMVPMVTPTPSLRPMPTLPTIAQVKATAPWSGYWKTLRIGKTRRRWLLLQQLAQQKDVSYATTILLANLKTRGSTNLWWTLTALRQHRHPQVVKALLPFLRHPKLRVRFSAYLALGAQHLPTVETRLRQGLHDASPFVREAVCRTLSQPAARTRLRSLHTCLQDNDRFLRHRIATQALQQPRGLSPRLLRQIKQLVRTGRKPSFSGMRLNPAASKVRMQRVRYELKRYKRYVQARVRRANRRFGKETIRCVTKLAKAFDQNKKRFQLYQRRFLEATRQNRFEQQQQQLALALLTVRRARGIYSEISRCRWRRNDIGHQDRFPSRSVWMPDFPLAIRAFTQTYLQVTGRFLHDSFFEALRDDLFQPYRSPKDPLSNTTPEFLFDVGAKASYNGRLSKDLHLTFQNRFSGQYNIINRPMSGLSNETYVLLNYAKARYRNETMIFLEGRFDYTQAPPGEEGWPGRFSGARWEQSVRIGAGWRWFTRQRRSRRYENKDSLIQIDYTNKLVSPFLPDALVETWARTMQHQLHLSYSHSPVRVLRLGLRIHGRFFHGLGENSTRQLSALHTGMWGNAELGLHPLSIRMIGSFGFNVVLPTLPGSITANDVVRRQAFSTDPIVRLSITGRAPRLHLAWFLRYDHSVGPGIRPNTTYYTEDRIHLNFTFSDVHPFFFFQRPRHNKLSMGLDVRLAEYPSGHLLKANEKDALPFLPISQMTFYARFSYNLTKSLRVTLVEQVSWVRHGFRSRSYEGDDGSTKVTDQSMRNLVFVQMEYWFGG